LSFLVSDRLPLTDSWLRLKQQLFPGIALGKRSSVQFTEIHGCAGIHRSANSPVLGLYSVALWIQNGGELTQINAPEALESREEYVVEAARRKPRRSTPNARKASGSLRQLLRRIRRLSRTMTRNDVKFM
jgi:hypothetical protein